jgi:hypothetical protein
MDRMLSSASSWKIMRKKLGWNLRCDSEGWHVETLGPEWKSARNERWRQVGDAKWFFRLRPGVSVQSEHILHYRSSLSTTIEARQLSNLMKYRNYECWICKDVQFSAMYRSRALLVQLRVTIWIIQLHHHYWTCAIIRGLHHVEVRTYDTDQDPSRQRDANIGYLRIWCSMFMDVNDSSDWAWWDRELEIGWYGIVLCKIIILCGWYFWCRTKSQVCSPDHSLISGRILPIPPAKGKCHP